HSARDDHIDAQIIQVVGQEAGPMSRVRDRLAVHDLIVFGFVDIEVCAVSKMRRHHFIFTGYRNFNHCYLPQFCYSNLRNWAALNLSRSFLPIAWPLGQANRRSRIRSAPDHMRLKSAGQPAIWPELPGYVERRSHQYDYRRKSDSPYRYPDTGNKTCFRPDQ